MKIKTACTYYNDCLDCPQYYKGRCHYEKSTAFELTTQLAGESKLFMSEFLYRVKLSWKARHWLNHKEYMNVLMDESKRGN